MYSALCIDEVLQLIFDFCGDLSDHEPKWTYSQLARCCKTWTDPALDRLWRRMGGLKPLLALLPRSDEVSARPFSLAHFLGPRTKMVLACVLMCGALDHAEDVTTASTDAGNRTCPVHRYIVGVCCTVR